MFAPEAALTSTQVPISVDKAAPAAAAFPGVGLLTPWPARKSSRSLTRLSTETVGVRSFDDGASLSVGPAGSGPAALAG